MKPVEKLISDQEINAAAEEFLRVHGKACYQKLIKAWDHDSMDIAQKYFKAGLAMGFAEALRVVRDAK